jgi:hypothetical protein
MGKDNFRGKKSDKKSDKKDADKYFKSTIEQLNDDHTNDYIEHNKISKGWINPEEHSDIHSVFYNLNHLLILCSYDIEKFLKIVSDPIKSEMIKTGNFTSDLFLTDSDEISTRDKQHKTE